MVIAAAMEAVSLHLTLRSQKVEGYAGFEVE